MLDRTYITDVVFLPRSDLRFPTDYPSVKVHDSRDFFHKCELDRVFSPPKQDVSFVAGLYRPDGQFSGLVVVVTNASTTTALVKTNHKLELDFLDQRAFATYLSESSAPISHDLALLEIKEALVESRVSLAASIKGYLTDVCRLSEFTSGSDSKFRLVEMSPSLLARIKNKTHMLAVFVNVVLPRHQHEQNEQHEKLQNPPTPSIVRKSVLQEWVEDLPMMQQSVLLGAIRGPDGVPKYQAGVKMLLRWYRRCILYSSLDGCILTTPDDPRGGSFTGPSVPSGTKKEDVDKAMAAEVDEFIRCLDGLPAHFQSHFMHAAEIVGYKHPDKNIRSFWLRVYLRMVGELHLHPETEEQLNIRLGGTREGWLSRADPATVK